MSRFPLHPPSHKYDNANLFKTSRVNYYFMKMMKYHKNALVTNHYA